MRRMLAAIALMLAVAAGPPAFAGSTVAGTTAAPTPIPASATPAQRQRLKDLDDGIAWFDELLRASDGGGVLFFRPYDLGEDDSLPMPVRTEDVVAMLKVQILAGKMTSKEAADLLTRLARLSGSHRIEMRARRAKMADERAALLRSIQQAASAPPPRPAPPPAVCVAEGVWSNDLEELGHSTWTIAADGTATESGIASVGGTASLSGRTLTINWINGAFSGRYTIQLQPNCKGGEGTMVWTRSPPDLPELRAKVLNARFQKLSGPGVGPPS